MTQSVADVALAVAAVALSVLVFATRGSVTTSERESRAQNVFTVWRPDEITRVVLERGVRRVMLERTAREQNAREPAPDTAPENDDTTWWITEPLRERAEPFAVHQLLSSLETATWLERFDEQQAALARGLDAPRISVRVDMDGISYRLLVGDASARRDAYYARIGGDGVPERVTGLVRREIVDDLGIAVDDLRNRELVPYGPREISRLQLQGPGSDLEIERSAQGTWLLSKRRGGLRANRSRVEHLFAELTDARLERFTDPAEAEKRLLQHGSVVKLTLAPKQRGKAELVLELGAPCPSAPDLVLVLRRAPAKMAGCVRKALAGALHVTSQDWVDHTPFFAQPDEIEELEIEDGKRRLDLVRVEQSFSLRAPVSGKVELDAGNQRLSALANLRAELLPEKEATMLEFDAKRRMTARAVSPLDGETAVESLLFTRRADGNLVLRREQDGALLAVDAQSAALFDVDATLIRSLQVLEIEPSQVLSIDVRSTDLHQTLKRTEGGVYELEAPEGYTRDGALASRLVDTLRSLRAVRWVSDQARGFDLDAPRIRVLLQTGGGDAGARQRELRVGAPTSGGAFATLDADGVFVVDPATLETLTTWVLDRSIFVLDTPSLRRLTIERGTERVVLSRRGDDLVQVAGSSRLTVDQISAATAALEDFYAEAALHLGPPVPAEGFARPTLVVDAELTRQNGETRRVAFQVGAGDAWRNVSIYYARRDGREATYAVARSHVTPLLGVFGR